MNKCFFYIQVSHVQKLKEFFLQELKEFFLQELKELSSGVKGVKELSLPAVAEELRQMPLEGNVLMFDFKQ